MELSYTIWDPTKNITLLVSTPVPRSEQSDAATKLMAERPYVEQVGFLEPATIPGAAIRLQMMGGEFCGNSTISTAAFLAEQDKEKKGTEPLDAVHTLEVSGSSELIRCRLSRHDERGWTGTVNMPLPDRFGTAELPGVGAVPAVVFKGITHCIVEAKTMTPPEAEAAIRPLCSVLKADACGIMLYDEAAGSFAPLVYVLATDTTVWESGCGSGSAALGAWLAFKAKKDHTSELRQPGGAMSVSAKWDGRITGLTITGHVALLERGTILY